MNYVNVLPVLLCGLLVVTLIATLGAIASRKFNFQYTWLSLASAVLYTWFGYLVAHEFDLLMALIVNNVIGFYDATVGLKLCIVCKANFRMVDEEVELPSTQFSVATMMFVSTALTFLGYLFA